MITTKKNIYVSAIVVAAGVGSRMDSDIPKQFIEVLGRPVIAYTLNALSSCDLIDEIIIVTLEDYLLYCKDIVDEFGIKKISKIIKGGNTRQMSVTNGLLEISSDADVVIIHDGVRPMVDADTIEKCIFAAEKYGASAAGVKVKDTLKTSDVSGFISGTVNRDNIYYIQTPQVFKKEIIVSAYESANRDGFWATDDCMIAEKAGYSIKIVEGKYENIKITSPQDIYFFEGLLEGGR